MVVFFLNVCICAVCKYGACRDQKKALDLWNWIIYAYELACGSLDSSMGLLQTQVFLIIKPFLSFTLQCFKALLCFLNMAN